MVHWFDEKEVSHSQHVRPGGFLCEGKTGKRNSTSVKCSNVRKFVLGPSMEWREKTNRRKVEWVGTSNSVQLSNGGACENLTSPRSCR
jgi:hypothetical protein